MVITKVHLLHELEVANKEISAVQQRCHGARRGKRKSLRRQETLLRQRMAEQLSLLIDLERSEQHV